MPLYDIKCSASGQISERFIKLQDFGAPIFCACGAPATRVISTPMFTVDQTDYQCPITDKSIRSKRDHEENLKLHNCRVLEPGETQGTIKRREKEEAEFDKKIENTVEKELSTWPSDKMEKLSNELVNQNLDVVVERK